MAFQLNPEGGDRNGSAIGSTIALTFAVQLKYICSTTEVQLAHCYISIGSTIGNHIRIVMAEGGGTTSTEK